MQIIPDIMSKQLTGITKYLPTGKEKLATNFSLFDTSEKTHTKHNEEIQIKCAKCKITFFLRGKKKLQGAR